MGCAAGLPVQPQVHPEQAPSWAGQREILGGPAWGPSLAPAVPWVSFTWFAFPGTEPGLGEQQDFWEEKTGERGWAWPSGDEPKLPPSLSWHKGLLGARRAREVHLYLPGDGGVDLCPSI